jgi:hypothetical protein
MPEVSLTIESSDPVATLWERLLSTRGLCHRGTLHDRRAGDTFSIETAAGDIFAGTITAWETQRELTLVIENMHDSVLRVTLEACECDDDDRTRLEFSLAPIGLHHDEVDGFRSRWRVQLRDLFAGALASG